jgi:hypothetical protein
MPFPELYDNLAPGVPGQVFTRAHNTTAARFEVPPQWRQKGGAIVTFVSSDATAWVLFGGAGVKAVAAAVVTVVGETLAPSWGSAVPVLAGQAVPLPVLPEHTHFSVVSSAASGSWTAYLSSGSPTYGEQLDTNTIGTPVLWLDAGLRGETITLNSGAITVNAWRSRVAPNYVFTEGSAYPDWLDMAAVSSGVIKPAVQCVTASSEKLVCTDATLAALLGGTNAFTLMIAARRDAAGANHTLFSVGTTGSNNGRWDFSINSTDDAIMTRVTSGGSSSTSTNTTNIASGDVNIYTWTFDGSTPLYWQDRTSTALTGTAAGDVGTTTKVTIGARGYNTSTFDQYASAQIMDVIVFSEALTGDRLDRLHAWAKRRFGQ